MNIKSGRLYVFSWRYSDQDGFPLYAVSSANVFCVFEFEHTSFIYNGTIVVPLEVYLDDDNMRRISVLVVGTEQRIGWMIFKDNSWAQIKLTPIDN